MLDKNNNALKNLVKIINPNVLVLGKNFKKSNDKNIAQVIDFVNIEMLKRYFMPEKLIIHHLSFISSQSDLIKIRDKFIENL